MPAPPIETVREIRDRCLCLATQRAARRLARRFDRLFAPLGITNGQFSLMVALCGEWRPRLGELADFLAMDSTTLTAATKALAKRGLLTMEVDETDARVRRPRLTDEGRTLVAQAVPLWKAEHARLDAELPGDPQAMARSLADLG
ncbi:MarR family winged helix-turn-helix transcriptional regulator [Wenxinia marina]|uniref:MarR family winged helix-turn-helix transcriptional regulator n=1 Tax=Wenxinia marina TaxID=390641 RepID=UPI00037E7A85|nr:MarR family transcriptional regulator [Wenxinia marina]